MLVILDRPVLTCTKNDLFQKESIFTNSHPAWRTHLAATSNCLCVLPTGTKLSEDSRKYGSENSCTSGTVLSKAAMSYSSARMDIERERENLLKALGTQVQNTCTA